MDPKTEAENGVFSFCFRYHSFKGLRVTKNRPLGQAGLSGRRDSNPRCQLGRLMPYHLATPALWRVLYPACGGWSRKPGN